VGISFYTFQTLSYTIDVYREKIPVHRSVTDFFAFVSFFPQLVAGPIERAGNLLGQFAGKRRFDPAAARDGCRQMLWGFVKKVVVADNLSSFVEAAYATPHEAGGATLLVATFFFAIQIYCDFSGYSDIAIGCARLFGFRLMRNFAYPYFATSISDFWSRWHISLSTWFRDYVYIPLGGGRTSLPRRAVNVFVTFLVSGFWHGANWTFLVWGALHGIYYLPEMILAALRGDRERRVRFVAIRILWTFFLVCVGWVFFRAATVGDAGTILARIATETDPFAALRLAMKLKLLAVALLGVEWVMRKHPHALHVEGLPRPLRWSIYYALVLVILFLGNFSYAPFIYFQF
jgi:D-alanyl-lipoteichoic acid acyltransferase DltB (MBOAT superfamily)